MPAEPAPLESDADADPVHRSADASPTITDRMLGTTTRGASAPGPSFAAQGPAPLALMIPPGGFGDPRLTQRAAQRAEAREQPAPQPTPPPEATPETPKVDDEPGADSPLSFGDFTARGWFDAYAVANWSNPRSRTASVPLTGYDMPTGLHFGLFALDLIYARPTFVAKVDLRFGPNALAQNVLDIGTGLEYITQALGTWLPRAAKGKVALDVGKFMSPIGLEAYNPWDNVAYAYAIPTAMMVPNTHLGARVNFFPTEKLALSVLAVNSIWLNLDNNRGKSFGATLTHTPSDRLALAVSYMTGPENPDVLGVACDAGTAYDAASGTCAASLGAEASTTDVTVGRGQRPWMHIADANATLTPGHGLRFAADGMIIYDRPIDNPVTRSSTSSLSLGAIALAEWSYRAWGSTGIRASAVYDRDGFVTGYVDPRTLTTAPLIAGEVTLNFSFSPNRYLDFMIDNRVDMASRPYYDVAGVGLGQAMFSSMFSVMVHVL